MEAPEEQPESNTAEASNAEAGNAEASTEAFVRKSMSSATWRPQKGAAEVFEQRGKLLMRMGFIQGGKIHIHMEEALYLMERKQLRLYDASAKNVLTLRQAFELMLTSGVTKDQFLLFSHLMEAAMIVRRHPTLWNLGPRTHPSSIWGAGAWAAACPCPASSAAAADEGEAAPLRAEPARIQALLHPSSHAQAAQGASKEEDSATLPNGRSAKRQKLEDSQEKGLQRSWWPVLAEAEPAGNEPAQSRGVVVEEEPASSTADLLHLWPFPSMPAVEGASAAANIAFDVHKPNSRFSRKNPDPPLVHVCLLKERRPPTREAMLAAEAAAVQGASVCYAYVTQSDVALYAFEKIELPSLL